MVDGYDRSNVYYQNVVVFLLLCSGRGVRKVWVPVEKIICTLGSFKGTKLAINI